MLENEIKLVEILLSPLENFLVVLSGQNCFPAKVAGGEIDCVGVGVERETIKSELTTIYLNKVVLKSLLKHCLGTTTSQHRSSSSSSIHILNYIINREWDN